MSKIVITTDDQKLSFTNMPDIYSGDVNYDEVEFIFDSTWDSMSRTAIFFTKETESEPTGVYLSTNNTAKIPSELITKKGILYIGVFGVIGDDTIKTSEIVKYDIGKGTPKNTKVIEEVATEYWQQVLSAVGDMQQDVTDVNNNLSSIQSDISSLNSRVVSLENYDTTNTSNINNIKSDISNIKSDISNIKSDISNMKTNISNLQTSINNIEFATTSEINTYLGIS